MDDDAAHELVANGQQAVDELSRTVTQCTDSISSAASELTHARSGKEVASAASELKQAVLQGKEQVGKDVSRLRSMVGTARVDTRLVNRPWLFGLLVPAPHWPPERLTVNLFLRRARPVLGFALLIGCLLTGVGLLLAFLTPLLLLICPPGLALYVLWRSGAAARAARSPPPLPEPDAASPALDWRADHAKYFSAGGAGQARREATAREVLASVQPEEARAFNAHVASATGLAVYGCGILAAAHVGGLRALERHGLRYERITTLAGVSAGSVVVAMLSLGCDAAELYALIASLPFDQLGRPELGALLRAGSVTAEAAYAAYAALKKVAPVQNDSRADLGGANGPGINSGAVLESMVGDAIRDKCGDADITLGQVKTRFGKRLVIIVSELDSGRERQLTPEDDAHLPLRVAVRMSMGVPGIMEPLRYQGHVYCDGGMTNDFPMNALPEGPGRLGLMVRPKEWVMYNSGMGSAVDALTGSAPIDAAPGLRADLEQVGQQLKAEGCYPVRSPFDLMMTSVQTMMDANLALQIKGALRTKPASAARAPKLPGLFDLAPEIITLCGGSLSPFDFGLGKAQHLDLFHVGQLCTHLIAAQSEPREGAVMRPEARLKTVLLLLHFDYPAAGAD